MASYPSAPLSKALEELYTGMPNEPDWSEEDLGHFFADAVYARRITVKKGNVARFHVHGYGHLAIIALGHGKLMKENEVTLVGPADCIEIKAGERHAILADEDLTFFCVHGDIEEARRLYGGRK